MSHIHIHIKQPCATTPFPTTSAVLVRWSWSQDWRWPSHPPAWCGGPCENGGDLHVSVACLRFPRLATAAAAGMGLGAVTRACSLGQLLDAAANAPGDSPALALLRAAIKAVVA
jgi:hypothetical protein